MSRFQTGRVIPNVEGPVTAKPCISAGAGPRGELAFSAFCHADQRRSPPLLHMPNKGDTSLHDLAGELRALATALDEHPDTAA